MSNSYLKDLSAAVTKRCGICQETVEVVLPALFDEIRHQLIESKYHSVVVYSFGVFGVRNMPERSYRYYRPEKGIDKMVNKPARKMMKFAPSPSLNREIDAGVFDESRTSFTRHPADRQLRRHSELRHKCQKKSTMCKVGQFITTPPSDHDDAV